MTGAAAPQDLETFDIRMASSKVIKGAEFNKGANQTSHGRGVSVFKDDKISNHWLEDPDKCGLSQSEFMGALKLRSNSAHTRSTMKGKTQTTDAVSCRLCGFSRETLPHIIGNCPQENSRE